MTSDRVIRLCAGFDLIVTASFALPFLSGVAITLMYASSGWVGYPIDIPEFSAFAMLFVNLMGTMGVVWALARLAFPLAKFGWIDAWARLWVSCLLIYYLAQPGIPVMISLIIATELIGAWAQFWVLRIPEF